MLRQVSFLPRKAAVLRHSWSSTRRTMMTTAAQKRALNKSQLEGNSPKPPVKPPTGGDNKKEVPVPPPPTSDGSNNNSLLIGVAAVAALGVGGYLYSQQSQPVVKEKSMTGLAEQEIAKVLEKKKDTPKEPVSAVAKKQAEEPTSKKKEVEKKPEPVKTEETPKALEKEETPKVEKKEAAGHRVTTIHVPPPGTRPASSKPAEISHPPLGNRVAMEPKKAAEATAHLWTADAAAQELRSKDDDEASATLQMAHKALRANLDESLLTDVNNLSDADLKVRVVQLAAEMKERTKWEAVRLKEFLALKEKETADKYMEILQQQRMEFEALLARRLLDQEQEMTRQHNAALQAKEDSIQSVVKASVDAQEAEHKADLDSTEQRLSRELAAKYEAEYSNKLAAEKAEFAKELETKMATLEELSSQLQQLESSLEASKTFESGSQMAHRVSAAAMALGAKLETNKGAHAELAALSYASGDNGVIATALKKIPEQSVKEGVPTLSELQARFETIQKKARQAAMVPKGWSGLEGQLMGLAFSTLKLSPSPEEAEVDDDGGAPDFILVKAQRHVQLGELDRAVEQLDKLDGQAAFTIRDWKQAAKDRIAVNNALKVIKMECALLNESHSGGSKQ